MQCSDLDRYLEAFLDERLGRGRSAILRRHIGSCSTCRLRIAELRRFEKELNLKLRSMQANQSIWSGLELDLVRSASSDEERALPPSPQEPPIARVVAPVQKQSTQHTVLAARDRKVDSEQKKQWVKRSSMALIGALLVAAASGTVYRMVEPMFVQNNTLQQLEVASALPDLTKIKGEPALGYSTDSAVELRRWFLRQTGTVYPALPTPENYALVGGSIDASTIDPTAVAVYQKSGVTAHLTITPVEADFDAASAQKASLSENEQDGVFQWHDEKFAYSLISSSIDTAPGQFKNN